MSETQTRQELTAVLEESLLDHQVFAVVDAACFDCMQDTLFANRLTFDALYLDEVDAPSIASGPHLVHPTGRNQISTILDLVGDSHGCVWWIVPDRRGAGDAMRRHLRGLNMVEIPHRRFDAAKNQGHRAGYEAVLFRHADGNVMACVLPVLEPAQLSRLFGGATKIIVNAPRYPMESSQTVRATARPATLPDAPRGLLRLDEEQYEAIAEARLIALRPAVDRYLRRATPERAQQHGTPDYDKMLTRILSEGRAQGLRGTKAFCRYGLMIFASNGQMFDSQSLRGLLTDTSASSSADMRLDKAFDAFVRRL